MKRITGFVRITDSYNSSHPQRAGVIRSTLYMLREEFA